MKFKIEELKKEAKENNWELLSEEYKNLDIPLNYICAKGHEIILPYKKVRHKYECPICKKFNEETSIKILQDISEKLVDTKRTLALDQSSKITGFAIFDNSTLIKYGIFEVKGKEPPIRYIKLRNILTEVIDFWKPDLILLEDIQLQTEEQEGTKNVLTYKILAELLGVLEVLLTELNVSYELVNIAKWRNAEDIGGKYREDKKKQARERVKECYSIDVTDDEADAILIGRYGILAKKEIEMIDWK